MEKKTKIKPTQDRVLLRRSEPERRTAAGIVIPDTAGEKPDQGVVEAVGPGRTNEKGERVPVGLRPGDRVLFGKYAGQTVRVDGEELILAREDDVLAVIENEQ